MTLENYVARQKVWSLKTFGAGFRAEAILNHIGLEVEEARQEPRRLEEYCDIIILALDAMWRAGYSTREIVDALQSKQDVNRFEREWVIPDDPEEPVSHVK